MHTHVYTKRAFFVPFETGFSHRQLQLKKSKIKRLHKLSLENNLLKARQILGITVDHRRSMNQQCPSLAKKGGHRDRIRDKGINCTAAAFPSSQFCWSTGLSFGITQP